MEKTVSFYLTLLYKDFLTFSTKELKKLSVNYGQLGFIVFIGKFKNCTQSELKSRLNVDWGHSQRVINKLVDDGIVNKIADENDKRIYHLSLTTKGEEAFKLSHELFKRWDEVKLNALSDEEKEELFKIFNKLARKEKTNGKF